MAIHEHENPGEFEAGCPACELDEVSLQDAGRPWAARVIRHPSHAATRAHLKACPLPGQQDRRRSA
jgi:hypothetical protein